jgi:hypothetical protein
MGRLFFATCIAFCLQCANVYAMTFQVEILRGEPTIRATGEIIAGDVERLQAVLRPQARHSYGYYALILNSHGGDVRAAFEISRLMDRYPIHTYVAPGDRCVSACAAIVFIAGKEHIAVPGANLGFHGCYRTDTKEILSICNEQVAAHAFRHGTAYGAVMALIEDVPYNQIVWLGGQDADCWGINRYVISPKPDTYLHCIREAIRDVWKERP